MDNEFNEKYKPKQQKIIVGVNETGKLPPSAPDLERAVLGAIMLDKNAFDNISTILSDSCFYEDKNGIIFRAMATLFNKSEPIELLTVTNELRNLGTLESIGGVYYVTSLTNNIVSSANIEFHARIIQEKFLAREMIKFCSIGLRDAYENTTDVFELIDRVGTQVFNLTGDLSSLNTTMVGDGFVDKIKRIESFDPSKDTIGTSTGYKELDRLIHGLRKGKLMVIAAASSMGKTVAGLDIARHVSIQLSEPTLFVSYEMETPELIDRVIASEYEVPLGKIIDNDKSVIDYIMSDSSKYNSIVNGQLFFEDKLFPNINNLRSYVKLMIKKFGIKGLVVDYIQLLPPVENGIKGTRESEIAQISRGLKKMAKQLGIWIIALSQINKDNEKRSGSKRPMLNDLRESAAIGNDADIVMFVHRPEYYGIDMDENGESTQGIAEFIIRKNRNGALDTLRLRFKKDFTKFTDINPYSYSEPIPKVDDSPF